MRESANSDVVLEGCITIRSEQRGSVREQGQVGAVRVQEPHPGAAAARRRGAPLHLRHQRAQS